MQRSAVWLAFALLAAPCGEAAAQAQSQTHGPALSDAAKAMVGTWEFANADRDKRCTITLRADAVPVGLKVEFDRACAGLFPFVRDVAAWSLNEGDFLRLLDAKGKPILDFSEVESGIYEAPKPGEGILFIQNASAAGPEPRTAAQMAGEWAIQRNGKQICALTLSNTAVGEEFAVRVKQPCDQLVTRFGPTTWSMERGELVMKAARGQVWRFEEGDEQGWRRIPETADPMQLIKK
ncbi:MAG: AprI/Inh family metalloprotease inhibitor [Pseudomonadota bacterium]